MKKQAWLLGLLSASIGVAAHADDQGTFYGGSSAGLYYLEFDDTGFDEMAPTLRLFGGFKLNDYLSFEAGYTNLFESSGDILGFDADVDGSAWDLSVRPTLPLSDTFSAFGILGWTDYEVDVSLSDSGISGSDSDDDLLYGLGGAWRVSDAWTVRGEWQSVGLDDADFGIFSVGATYSFQ